jgi:hypothetical protein
MNEAPSTTKIERLSRAAETAIAVFARDRARKSSVSNVKIPSNRPPGDRITTAAGLSCQVWIPMIRSPGGPHGGPDGARFLRPNDGSRFTTAGATPVNRSIVRARA